MLNLLGQPTYNVVYGGLIIVVGLLFAALPYLKGWTRGAKGDGAN